MADIRKSVYSEGMEPNERRFVAAELPPIAGLEEIARVLDETARLVREHASAARRGGRPVAAGLRRLRDMRELRRAFFPSIPGDPAWAMLLELYAARLEGRPLSQSELTRRAGVAPSTALRLIRKLVQAGLLGASADPDDRRLLLLALSDPTAERMTAFLAALPP